MPRYWNMISDKIFDAARTVIRLLLSNSYKRAFKTVNSKSCSLAYFHSEIPFPEFAVGGAASHGPEQIRIDLDDFAHRLGR